MHADRITIIVEGLTQTHAASSGVADYATLCGLDSGYDGDGNEVVPTPKGQKIDCECCKALWESAQRLRASDFE